MIASPTDLEYFLEVTKKLNLSRAAERIGISQPSLSVAMKRLEDIIGAKLFIRQKNGLILTQAGRRLELHTQQLLQMWHNVKSETLASHIDVQGHIRFGCHPSVALYTLAKFMPQLLSQYPKLTIDLQHDLSRKILEGIINLTIDVGIVVNPIRHPDLVLTKLYQDKVSFYCNYKIKNVDQLINNDDLVIVCDPELSQTKYILNKFSKKHPHRLLTSSNHEVIATLTQEVNCVGILPHTVVESTRPKSLKVIDTLPSYQDDIYLAYRHENREIMAIKTLIEHIKGTNWK